jgi:hypothetical protein
MTFRSSALPPPWPSGATRVLLYVGIPAALVLFALEVTALGLSRYALVLCAAVVLSWVIWRFPMQAAVTLIVISPMNRFLLMLLFTATHSLLLLRAAQLWKDLILVVLIVRMMHEAFERRRSPRLLFLDLLIFGFILLCGVYLIDPGPDRDLSILTRVMGFRFDTFFLMAYYIGRGIDLTEKRVRVLLLAAVPVCIATAAVAYWQWLRPEQATRVFEHLGYSAFREAVGATDPDLIRERVVGGSTIPRAASLAMGDLALAFYQVFITSVAGALYFAVRGRWQQLAAGAFVIAMIATLVTTNNRSGLIATLGILVLLALWTRAFARFAIVLVVLGILGLLYLSFTDVSVASLRSLLSFQEDSAVAHVDVVKNSLRLVRESPIGYGLGSVGPISIREESLGAFITESWYLQLALEIGVVGGVLFAVIIVLAICYTLDSALRVRHPWLRILSLGIAGAMIGYAGVGAVLHVWEVTPVSMVIWLFVGIAVRAPAIEREWNAAGEKP